jgi:hypothetical protein
VNSPLTASEVHWLLHTLCVELGFCLAPAAQEQLKAHAPTDVEGFTDAVFVAEGFNPSSRDGPLYRKVSAVVAEAFRRSEEARD